MGKKARSGSGMNILDHIIESLEKISWVKILEFFDADPDPDLGSGNLFDHGSGNLFDHGSGNLFDHGSGNLFDHGSGMEKIRIRDPG
jgi:hypothetical protein